MEPKVRTSAFHRPVFHRSDHLENRHSPADPHRSCGTCQPEDIPDRSSLMEPSSRTVDPPDEHSCCGSSSTDHAKSRDKQSLCRSRQSEQRRSHLRNRLPRGICHRDHVLGRHSIGKGCTGNLCTSRKAFRMRRNQRSSDCSPLACSNYRCCNRCCTNRMCCSLHHSMDRMFGSSAHSMLGRTKESCSLRRMDIRAHRRRSLS